jgi:hypothetical protein
MNSRTNIISKETNPAWLLDHAKNVYSQFGEDGVLEAALNRLPRTDRCCVEFGAWDGLHLSNTANLIRNEGYEGVFIEGDSEKVSELKKNYADFPKVRCFCQMVGWNRDDGLDGILSLTELPLDFDLLSIDIDGNDYHVWHAVNKYQPKLVIIEFNQTMPTEIDYHQPPEPQTNVGSSIKALVDLGRKKGYLLISILRNNLLFVREEYFHLYGIEDNSPSVLRKDVSEVTWFFIGYDGSLHYQGNQRMPWHEMEINPDRLQLLPKMLRVFPPCYSSLKRFAFRGFRWWLKVRSKNGQ